MLAGLAACACLLAAGCGGEGEYPSRPITLICPWAAGGGTDRVSRQVAAHLEQDLGVPVSVVNATGGKGVTGHSRALHARPDGYTLGMITLELNMMHWSGLTELTYEDCIPLMSVNEDYAALFVRNDAPWQTLGELEADIRETPKALKASGTSSGGAWHLALAGWLLAAQMPADEVVWISSTGANPSLQELMSGGVDMVCCSLPEAEIPLRAGEIRALGVMSPRRVEGYESVATFAEQGRDWSLGGWRGLAVPLGTPRPVVDRLFAALERIVTGETVIVSRGDEGERRQTFPEFMQQAGFDHTWRPAGEFRAFLAETDEKFCELLTSDAMRTVNRDRYDPMTYPRVLMGLIVVTLALIGARRSFFGIRQESAAPAAAPATAPAPERVSGDRTPGSEAPATRTPGSEVSATRTPNAEERTARSVIRFGAIAAAVVVYCLAAETVGFVLLAGGLLFALLWWLGTRWWLSAAIAMLLVPAVYQMFAGVLRVPLPRGWWGW